MTTHYLSAYHSAYPLLCDFIIAVQSCCCCTCCSSFMRARILALETNKPLLASMLCHVFLAACCSLVAPSRSLHSRSICSFSRVTAGFSGYSYGGGEKRTRCFRVLKEKKVAPGLTRELSDLLSLCATPVPGPIVVLFALLPHCHWKAAASLALRACLQCSSSWSTSSFGDVHLQLVC